MSDFPSYPGLLEILSVEEARKRASEHGFKGAAAVMSGALRAQFTKIGDGPLTACNPNQDTCTPPIHPQFSGSKWDVVCVFWAEPEAQSTPHGAVIRIGTAEFAVLEPGGDDTNPGDVVAKSSAPSFALIEIREPYDAALAHRADMISTCFYFPRKLV